VAPYFLLIDEVERFVTPDLSDILDRGAGKGLHLGVFHQRLGQLRRRDEDLYDAIMTNTKTKLVFGGLSFDHAEAMARELFINQISYDEAKIIIEQTKFWPTYGRDKIYVRAEGGVSAEMASSGTGVGAGVGSGLSWTGDQPTFFAPDSEMFRHSESTSRAEQSSSAQSSSTGRVWSDGEADVPIFYPEPFKEVSSLTPYSLEEQWTRLTHRLMEQYQRHYFLKRRGEPAIPVATPFVEEFRIFPKREQAYIIEKLIKPYALSVDEIDQALYERVAQLKEVVQQGQRTPAKAQVKQQPKLRQQTEDNSPEDDEPEFSQPLE
jgi:hypothetical protein